MDVVMLKEDLKESLGRTNSDRCTARTPASIVHAFSLHQYGGNNQISNRCGSEHVAWSNVRFDNTVAVLCFSHRRVKSIISNILLPAVRVNSEMKEEGCYKAYWMKRVCV